MWEWCKTKRTQDRGGSNNKQTFHKKSASPVCQNKINQPWLTMQVMTTMWSTGRHQQSWTGNLTGAPGGSRRWYNYIQKEGRRSVNRDEGSYTLSHTYDRFLATSHHYRGKNRKKKNWTSFFVVSDRVWNVKVKICQVEIWINVYINVLPT